MDTNLTVDLHLAHPGLEHVRVLLTGRAMHANGDLETAFFDTATDIRRHAPGRALADVLRQVCERPDTQAVVLIRNPRLVLDPGLAGRLADGLHQAGPMGTWGLAAAGGMGLGDRRHMALYASATPGIPLPQGTQPLVDPMPDITLLNAAHVRAQLADGLLPDDAALELVLTVEGYLAGLPSIFVPALSAGVDGHLLARDLRRLTAALHVRFAERLPGQTIATLSGPVALPPAAQPSGAHTYPMLHLEDAIADSVAGRTHPPASAS